MKQLKAIALGLAFSLLSSGAFAAKVGGVELPDQFATDDSSLELNGAGVRKKFFMSVYVAALYLSEASNDGNSIATAADPMNMKLVITSGLVSREKMIATIVEGFEKASGGDLSAIQSDLDQFIAVFADGVSKGDMFDFSYDPDSGLHTLRNGSEVSVISNPAFKETLFGLWLSDRAVDAGLRKKLLGK